MEILNKKSGQMQQLAVSKQQLKQHLQQNKSEVSLYQDELTPEGIVESCATLAVAYPNLNDSYFKLLGRLAKKQGFTNQRLKDAIENTVLNCPYKMPSLSEVLNYDRTLKFSTYNEILKAIDSGASFADYKRVLIKDNIVYVSLEDFYRFNLKEEGLKDWATGQAVVK